MKNEIVLFVGDNVQHTADLAKEHDPNAFLIDFANWKKLLTEDYSTKSITAYTSLSDLPKINKQNVLWELLKISDKIYYVPPDVWSDYSNKFSWDGQKTHTEFLLYQCQLAGKTVVGLDLESAKDSSYLNLIEKRTDESDSLWMVGCSITKGLTVSPTERYGHLVGESLLRPTYHLAKVGSSLEWQADQILRSDIRASDIVIWGLTQEIRAPKAYNGTIIAWPSSTMEDLNYQLDETRYYKAITSVFQVINFCKKIGCRLVILPLICSEKLQLNLIHQDCYYQLPYQIGFIDYGSDNVHPGPEQHRIWADFCLKILDQ